MKTRSAKNKGKRLQVKVAEMIRECIGLDEDHVKSNFIGQMGEDILFSKEARKRHSFSYEIKNQESASIWAWMKQAKSNAGIYPPLVVFSRNRENDLYLTMRYEDFLKIQKELLELKAKGTGE